METMEATYSKKVFPRGRSTDNPANVLIASGQKPTKKPPSSSSSNASCFEPFEGEAGTLNGAAWVPRLEGAPAWGAPFSEMFYEGEKKMMASFGIGPISVASAKLQSGGRDRSPKGRIASPALPLNLVFASRDKESLLEEIICLKQILNDQAAFLQRNKVYASTVQAENRKLERDIEDLETGGHDNKSQGGTSRLRVKFQGMRARLETLQGVCEKQHDEISKLRRDVRFTCTREIELERDVFVAEVIRLQKIASRLKSLHTRLGCENRELNNLKDKAMKLEMENNQLESCVEAVNKSLEKANREVTMQRLRANDMVVHARKSCKKLQDMQKQRRLLESMIEKEKSEKMGSELLLMGLEKEMSLAGPGTAMIIDNKAEAVKFVDVPKKTKKAPRKSFKRTPYYLLQDESCQTNVESGILSYEEMLKKLAELEERERLLAARESKGAHIPTELQKLPPSQLDLGQVFYHDLTPRKSQKLRPSELAIRSEAGVVSEELLEGKGPTEVELRAAVEKAAAGKEAADKAAADREAADKAAADKAAADKAAADKEAADKEAADKAALGSDAAAAAAAERERAKKEADKAAADKEAADKAAAAAAAAAAEREHTKEDADKAAADKEAADKAAADKEAADKAALGSDDAAAAAAEKERAKKEEADKLAAEEAAAKAKADKEAADRAAVEQEAGDKSATNKVEENEAAAAAAAHKAAADKAAADKAAADKAAADTEEEEEHLRRKRLVRHEEVAGQFAWDTAQVVPESEVQVTHVVITEEEVDEEESK